MRFQNSFYRDVSKHSDWFRESHQRLSSIPEQWLPWLQERGSLTSALINYSNGEFRVRVLSERWAIPYSWEARMLGDPPHLAARIREVELLCNEQAMVYARSIIPLSVFKSEPFTFQGLGSKPLGHLLFQDGRARIRRRSISSYSSQGKSHVYGRMTPYEYHGGTILVSEFFVNPELVKP